MVQLAEWAQHIVTFRADAHLPGPDPVPDRSVHPPGARVEHPDQLPVAALPGGAPAPGHAALRAAGVSHGQPAEIPADHCDRLRRTGACRGAFAPPRCGGAGAAFARAAGTEPAVRGRHCHQRGRDRPRDAAPSGDAPGTVTRRGSACTGGARAVAPGGAAAGAAGARGWAGQR
ncbi:hypothetical protein G6F57_020757 [Rhizopus arrhizus]|nr:hypothetical protein G6F57_020757 [Rhizopus arrhizus]